MNKYWGGLILVLGILLIGFFNRWTFFYKFNPEYWENYYYESQWNVPNSKRVISDEGVYRYIGYRLVNGENPFNVDYWVPPLGKYWYGIGAKYFGNPYLVSWGWYIGSVIIFWLISKELFEDKVIQWIVLYLWAFNPLVVEQVSQTMLDMPMTTLFLAHGLFLLYFQKKSGWLNLIIAGMFLGLMAGTKPAYFVPLIGLVDWWFIYRYSKDKSALGWYVTSVIGGYMLAYSCYFLKHPNPIPWIRLHQKVVEFQKGNGGSHDVLNIFRTIFMNSYKGFWVGGKTMSITSWSILLPTGILTMLGGIWQKKIPILIKYWLVIGLGYVLMNLTIDFWPRYLVLLLPSMVVVCGYFFRNKKMVLLILLIGYIPGLVTNFFPKKELVINNYKDLISREFYRDAYQLTSQKINESEWMKKDKKNLKIINIDNQWKIDI